MLQHSWGCSRIQALNKQEGDKDQAPNQILDLPCYPSIKEINKEGTEGLALDSKKEGFNLPKRKKINQDPLLLHQNTKQGVLSSV